MGLVPKAIPIIRYWVKGEVIVKVDLIPLLASVMCGVALSFDIYLVFYP